MADIDPTPPDIARPVLLRQVWRDVALLHWPLDPALAAPLLPPGTRPDVLDGRTYAGVVALRIAGTAGPVGPPIPWAGTFGEVNVRLYSVDRHGRRAVVFLRMDAGRLLPVLAARALPRLPYVWSPTRVRRDGDRYAVTLGRPRRTLRLTVGSRLDPGPLEHFLTARWGLHARVAGRTVHLPLAHAPWVLHAAGDVDAEPGLLAAAGLAGVTGPPVSALYSPGVDDVRIGRPSGG